MLSRPKIYTLRVSLKHLHRKYLCRIWVCTLLLRCCDVHTTYSTRPPRPLHTIPHSGAATFLLCRTLYAEAVSIQPVDHFEQSRLKPVMNISQTTH